WRIIYDCFDSSDRPQEWLRYGDSFFKASEVIGIECNEERTAVLIHLRGASRPIQLEYEPDCWQLARAILSLIDGTWTLDEAERHSLENFMIECRLDRALAVEKGCLTPTAEKVLQCDWCKKESFDEIN